MTLLFNTLGLPEHARPLARLIHDYDSTVTLEKLPDGHPWLFEAPNKPYALVHRPMHAPEYVIESFPESMLDERILAILVEGDMHKAGKKLANFDPVHWARMQLESRKREDELGAANELWEFKMRQRNDTGKKVIR
jgi:hypothetical protein